MSSIVKKLKELWTPVEDNDEMDDYEKEYYDDEEYEESRPLPKKKKVRTRTTENENISNKGKKVVNLQTTAQLQVVVCKPERFAEETRNIADELLKSYTVVLNLEDTDKDASRRILDFLSGVAYAKVGKIKRIATNTYIITPCNVDITGEELVEGLESNGVYF